MVSLLLSRAEKYSDHAIPVKLDKIFTPSTKTMNMLIKSNRMENCSISILIFRTAVKTNQKTVATVKIEPTITKNTVEENIQAEIIVNKTPIQLTF